MLYLIKRIEIQSDKAMHCQRSRFFVAHLNRSELGALHDIHLYENFMQECGNSTTKPEKNRIIGAMIAT